MVKICRLRAYIAGDGVGIFIRRASKRLVCTFALAAAAWATCARAQPSARFDLTGPKIDVRVTRAGVTLPIASVPNLQPKDRLWLHPDLPPTQSVHYLMVLAFLRGTTNPPPDQWFIRIPTWEKKVRKEGVEVTVPDEAQQAVLFLAPVTGGDFTTLRSAVQGRPGIFVRASQDLAAAGFEQARIEKYIASMKELSPTEASDPKQLQEHSNLIGSTLALRPNADCVKLVPDQQYTCLTQSGGQSLLDDGHGQSVIDALTGGSTAGLIGTVSATQLAGGGLYSAYVGSIVDLIHIMGTLHTAQYQYIPAIAFPQQQAMNLRLNTAPSFHNPKSVIVIGLPSIQQTIPPPLRAANPKLVSCLQKPGIVLHVEGAPLVYSTAFAHDLVLHLNLPPGAKSQDIPLIPDAFRGGLMIAPAVERRPLPTPKASDATPSGPEATPLPKPDAPNLESSSGQLTGTVKGFWGFDPFVGPTMLLQNAPGKDWKLTGDQGWLIAGKERHVLLSSTGTGCIESIALDQVTGEQKMETWKPADRPNAVDVALDVPAHDTGAQQLSIRQYGDSQPATVKLVSYNEPAKLEALHFHAGDTTATLSGTGLDQVRQVEFAGLTFKPAGEEQEKGKPELRLALQPDAKTPALHPGEGISAHVALQDGRILSLAAGVEAARPSVTLIGHSDVVTDAKASDFHIKLANENDLPVGDAMMFSLKSSQPFPRAGEIEVGSPDGSLHTTLGLGNPEASSESDARSSLILEGPQTLLGTLKPLKVFGPSAFGPIRLRAIAPDGTKGDWLPLVTLVRLPTLSRLNCAVATPVESTPAKRHGPAAIHNAPAMPPNPSPANPDSLSAEPSVAPPSAPADSPPAAAAPSDSAIAPKPDTTPKPDGPAQAASCTLAGSGLYFIDSIATDADFTNPVRVPEGFVGTSLTVPAPTGAVYYLRLRDDPSAVNTVTLPAGPL
jgi:hypothetical protein